MSKVLTPARRARLEKLAAYLEGLPADYSHFDMGNYIVGPKDDFLVSKYALENGGVKHCGTAACAVGHGPAAGILMPKTIGKQFGVKPSYELWNRYAKMFVGPSPYAEQFAEPEAFSWLFSEDWGEVDNHHFGAAARIRYILDHGGPPEDWDYGDETLDLYAPYRIDAKAPADA